MKKKSKILFSSFIVGVMAISMLALPIKVNAATEGVFTVDGNKLYANGNDVIVQDENGTTYASSGGTKVVVTGNTFLYAGSKEDGKTYNETNITVNSGTIGMISGSNGGKGTVKQSNVTVNGGKIGIIYGNRSNVSGATEAEGGYAGSELYKVEKTKFVINDGLIDIVIPGPFGYSFVQNAYVEVNGGEITGYSKEFPQSGILGGTNGKIENLTINVNGGKIKDISACQRTMITNKVEMNIKKADVGMIYAGSYYDDLDSYAGSKWNTWKKGDVNYGQAASFDINIVNTVYKDIAAGFQYLDKEAYKEKFGSFISDISGSEKAPISINTTSEPTKEYSDIEKTIVSVFDKTYTTVSVADLVLDKTDVTLEIGNTTKLNATITPSLVNDKKVAFTSSDETVATVSDAGVVTAKKAGTATIAATAGGKTATCTVTVKAIPVEPDKPVITPPVDKVEIADKESENVVKDTVDSVLKDIVNNKEIPTNVMSAKTVAAVKEAIASGKTVTTVVQSKEVKESDVSKEVVNKVNSLIEALEKTNNSNITIAQYLDLGVMLVADNQELGNLNVLDKEIKLSVTLPKELIKDGRTFYVVRVHEGKVEKLDAVLNSDGTLTFKTDRFSTYALAYEDKVTTGTGTDTVKTNDNSNIVLLTSVAGLAFVVGSLVVLYKKKMNY